jgi:hypothetical protein
MLKLLRVSLIGLAVFAGIIAQNAAPTGRWEGTIQAPNREVKFSVDLDRTAQQAWIGHVDLDPGPKAIPVKRITVEGDVVKWSIAAPGDGAPTFEGKWNPETNTITGTATQAGTPMAFTLKRTGDAKVVVPPESTAISKDVQGRWEGTLNAYQPLRLVLELQAGPDGKAAGTLTSVDQNNARLPVNSIVQKDNKIEFGVAAVGGRFVGTTNESKDELTGEWTQGPNALPLSLKKSKPAEEKK